MTQTDTSAQSEPESSVDSARTAAKSGREYLSKAAPYLRRGVESDAVTAAIGGTGLLGGLRALRDGERGRGLVGLVVGAGFVALTLARRRFRHRGEELSVEEADVADTGPDVEAVADEAGGVGEGDGATDEAVADAVDTSPDVESVESDAEPESEPESGTNDGTATTEEGATADDSEAEDVDRLGEAAFDGQSREVPAPQRAFDRGFLAHSAEAFWGIRSGDDAVLVSQDYDAIEGQDEVHYVASSEIGADARELPIPDVILNHWNEVLDDAASVTGGDDVLFVTTDRLAADGVLRVLPSKRADGRAE
ncbi:hypothetical protein KTS45_03290 [Halomicroarcula limicola]|uniref:Uncharacterized protein n=1 Tax=Haloarcula limicola TaxID=1429915 RepID=A0A8J7Y7P2_9EURY|nr:hypothetical protein [Halomicroarcula limicola]MBV0923214.1 hypothetical protein [Halomicroarcula limicola]